MSCRPSPSASKNATPEPIVSGRYFLPTAPLLCLKRRPAAAVTSVNCTAAGAEAPRGRRPRRATAAHSVVAAREGRVGKSQSHSCFEGKEGTGALQGPICDPGAWPSGVKWTRVRFAPRGLSCISRPMASPAGSRAGWLIALSDRGRGARSTWPASWGIAVARRAAAEDATRAFEGETAARARALESVLANVRADMTFLAASAPLTAVGALPAADASAAAELARGRGGRAAALPAHASRGDPRRGRRTRPDGRWCSPAAAAASPCSGCPRTRPATKVRPRTRSGRA